jgi:hypothetical protein
MNFKKILKESLESMMDDIKNLKPIQNKPLGIENEILAKSKIANNGKRFINIQDVKNILAKNNKDVKAISSLINGPDSFLIKIDEFGNYMIRNDQ